MKYISLLILLSTITLAQDTTKVNELKKAQAVIDNAFSVRQKEIAQRDSVCVWLSKQYWELEKAIKEEEQRGQNELNRQAKGKLK